MEAFLIYLIKSTGLLCLFLLFYFLLLKRDTTFSGNRKFLLGGLVLSAVLPALYFTRTILIEATPIPVFYNEGETPVTEMLQQEPPVSLLQVLFLIYILGATIMLVRFILQFCSLGRIFFSGNTVASGRFKLIHTTQKIAPFSFLNFIVYNPSLHTANELQHILKHEEVHVLQWHSADVLLANLNLIYQWFNPIAWLYLKNLQQNLEYIADSEAVKKASCKKEYQRALVKISVENYNLDITNNFYQSLIKKRIMMLNRPSTRKQPPWKTILILPALLAFLLLFNVKTVAQVIKNDDEKPLSVTAKKNKVVSVNITKSTTREQLGRYTELLEKYNVQLDFEEVEYNEQGKLISITANFLDRNNNTSGSLTRNANNGIKSFMFYYNAEEGSGFKTSISASGTVNTYTSKFSDSLEQGDKVLYVLNGKRVTAVAMDTINPVDIDSITVIKGKQATNIYGSAAGKGVIVVHTEADSIKTTTYKTTTSSPTFVKSKVFSIASAGTKEHDSTYTNNKSNRTFTISKDSIDINASQYTTRTSPKKEFYFSRNPPEDVFYLVDGKEMSKDFEVSSIERNSISSINVLKGDAATKKYGEKGKNGVIEISTRDSKLLINTPAFATVNSSTTEEGLKFTQQQLKEQANLLVTFDEVERNKKGLITRIKVTGKRGNSHASATYEVKKGIPDILIGVRDNSVIISSNSPKK